jgi:hypothetical protein
LSRDCFPTLSKHIVEVIAKEKYIE